MDNKNFPDGPVVKFPGSQCGFHFWLGNYILQIACMGQKKTVVDNN